MELNTCRSCGGVLERAGNYYVCKFCGNKWEIDVGNDIYVVDRANAWAALRDCDFEAAVERFENIILKEKDNHEAYWGRALALGGIIYVNDMNEHKKVPTCNSISEESFLESKDVISAIGLAPQEIASTYKKQAAEIEKIRVEWLDKARKEPPYDVFICFKDSDREHNIDRTDDSYDAHELYNALTTEGYNVFFSRVSLRDKVSEHYEPYIYNAIKTAKVMIVFGEKPEYFNAVWVKNEWSRFRAKIETGEKHKNSLVVAYKNMSPADLPISLRTRQCLNAADITFLSDLTEHIKKVIEAIEENRHLEKIEIKGGQKTRKASTLVKHTINTREIGQIEKETSIDEKQLLDLVPTYIAAYQWHDAEDLLKNILFENPSSAEAMWLSLFVKYKKNPNKSGFDFYESFDDKDFATLEKILSCADKDFACEVLDTLYGTCGRVSEKQFNKMLDIILPYKYGGRTENVATVFAYVKESRNFEAFKKVIESLESDEVDRYIIYNAEYIDNTTSVDEKMECAKNIIEVDEGNRFALQTVLTLNIAKDKEITCLIADIERLLAVLSSNDEQDDFIKQTLSFILSEKVTKNICEFIKQLVRYYNGDISELAEQLNGLANLMLESDFFDEAKYIYRIILSADSRYADAYLGICLANIKVASLADLASTKILIKKQTEFNKYLTLLDEKKRLDILKLANRQERILISKKRRRRFVLIATPVAVGSIIAVLALTFVVIPNLNYEKAVSLMDAGKYDEAITAFEALGEHKDSVAKIEACHTAKKDIAYDSAVALMNEGKYDEAITALEALGEHKDRVAKIEACHTR